MSMDERSRTGSEAIEWRELFLGARGVAMRSEFLRTSQFNGSRSRLTGRALSRMNYWRFLLTALSSPRMKSLFNVLEEVIELSWASQEVRQTQCHKTLPSDTPPAISGWMQQPTKQPSQLSDQSIY
jgi:hypothetical protein